MIRVEHACVIPLTSHLKEYLLEIATFGESVVGSVRCGALGVFLGFPLMCIKMSDVRLSNASPTLERVDARQQDIVRPSVHRSLFGRPDPAETRRNLANMVQEDVQAFRDTYNFDPEEGPLSSGHYVWQEDPDAPDFYSRPPHRRPTKDEDSPGTEGQREEEEEDAAAERSLQPGKNRGRKRQTGDFGSCSTESQGAKKSRTDEDDDDEDDDGGDGDDDDAGNQNPGALQENGSSVVA